MQEAVDRHNSEGPRLIARARADGGQYEFAQCCVVEIEPDRVKIRCRNQRRIAGEERRLRKAIGDLPFPSHVGSSEVQDKAYCAICAFEVEQLTYSFSCCDICKERRLECKGSGNMCTCCKGDKNEQKLWSGENNVDPRRVPEELSGMTDAEQMLISRLAPTCSACTSIEAWMYCFKGVLYYRPFCRETFLKISFSFQENIWR